MTDNPIEAAKAITPWRMLEIHRFDGLEIHPCRVESVEDGKSFIEQCEPEEAQFWSVYAHLKEGGVSCIEDFASPAEARGFAEELLIVWPHLQEFGLLDCAGFDQLELSPRKL